MSKIVDISKLITNEQPKVIITDNITVSVNNRKKTVLNIQAMIRERERKAEADGETLDEMEFISKALEMLVGKTKAKEIEDLNLPLPEYKLIYDTVMGTVSEQIDTPTE